MADSHAPRRTPTSTHWGTYFAHVKNDQLLALEDFAKDPHPAEIGPGWADMPHHPCRIRQPMVRRGFLDKGIHADRRRRGNDSFVALSWDEAWDLAAGELQRVREQHGNQAIYGGSYGWASAGRFHHAQSHIHRFLNCMGGYTRSVDTYSYAAVSALTPHIIGPFNDLILDHATAMSSVAEHCELLVAFGGLPLKNAQITSGGVGRHTLRENLQKAKANGCDIVNISPLRSDMDDSLGAQWLPVIPHSDTALMLALCHVLYEEQRYDRDFLKTYCVGFERFLPYLTGQSDGVVKTPEWASPLCDVPADDIRRLARRMAARRTMICVAWSLQRADHGEQPCWAALVLAAMLGQIGQLGTGIGYGYGSENGIGNPVRLFKFPALPQGQNPVAESIPVARISDALLSPGQAYDFNGQRRIFPDLRLVYWAGGNPFHHHQDLNKLVRAFQQPECIIVNECWWTPMAKHADIVFPATTNLEREDISMTHWEPTLVAMRQALQPVGQALDDYDIFSGLAERLDCVDRYREGRDAEAWIAHLWQQARERATQAGFELPTLSEFRGAQTWQLPEAVEDSVLLADFRRDPTSHPLSTPSGRLELFSQRIADFGYVDCPGHPVWITPKEWLHSERCDKYPLHLISNQPSTRLHSQCDPGRVSMASKIQGREPLTLHPSDAEVRGLVAGDVARVFNARGACLAGVRISDQVKPGVVQMATGAWYDPLDPSQPDSLCKHGSVNVLTRDEGTSSLGQGPSAHSALVQIEKYREVLPEVTAHKSPEIQTQ